MKSFSSKRQRNRSKMRRMHGNPWDSSSSSSSRRNTSRKKSSKRVTFKSPRHSKSSKSSSHAAWRSVSSKK